MIKVLLLIFILPIFFLLTVVGVLLTVRPVREALLRHLGKRIARSAQSGRWKMEVRTWKFEAPRTQPRNDFRNPLNEHEAPLQFDQFRQLKDVTPSSDSPPVDKNL